MAKLDFNAVPRGVIKSRQEGAEFLRLAETQTAEQRAESRYRKLYDQAPCPLFTLDAHGNIRGLNQFGLESLGYAIGELFGRSFFDFLEHEHAPSAVVALRSCLDTPQMIEHLESCMLTRDGTQLWSRLSWRSLQAADGRVEVLVACGDSSRTRELSEELLHQSRHDYLTGLPNRRQLNTRMSDLLLTTRDSSTENALCYLDIDQFKVINDTCGHVAGDDLLRQLADCLKPLVRRGDMLSRLGGDEFGVLMEQCSALQAEAVVEKFRAGITEFRFLWQGRRYQITVSIGLMVFDGYSYNPTEILQRADEACHAAKDAGRNRVHIYRAEDVELARRHGEMECVEQISRALEEDRFQLYYQTIMPLDGADESLAHYEVLLRMLDDDGIIVSPGAFLGAAERYNLAPKIDRWVVENVFSWLIENPDHLMSLGKCSINLSGLSLGDMEFVGFLETLFSECAIPPSCICFEITETAAIANLANAVAFIERLRKLGCSFALDDFGSGLSSFAYLKTLPVDYLKIDGFFVKDIADNPIDFAMVKSINEIGKVMGMKTVAEFVESEKIVEMLRDIGVDFAQGYWVAFPQPMDEMMDSISQDS
ncbi:MAG: diguanylate cyclase (GGDEF)-like protein/PAS domain S-box-containing protein [Halieaceae bacterium]|jgi:diguanylate cyclase (GGDEF)-like protein/PAS domain S-box-containing protein